MEIGGAPVWAGQGKARVMAGDGAAMRPMAVGQAAKAAAAAAVEAGAELPKNATGLAASAIARGADPGSIFAARVEPEAGPDDAAGSVVAEVPAADPGDGGVAGTGDAAGDPAPAEGAAQVPDLAAAEAVLEEMLAQAEEAADPDRTAT